MFIKSALPALIGLGLALGLMLVIPVLDLLVVPVGIQAGTLVFMSLEAAGKVPKLAPELLGLDESVKQ